MNGEDHTLKIISLHDAHAECSCGNWSLTATGRFSRAYIEQQFSVHRNQNRPAVVTLDTLHYSNDPNGPWALYIYDRNGYHSGPQWFSKVITYPAEEITVNDAFLRADKAVQEKLEIRVTDGGDNLVYHAKDGRVLYPQRGDFWKEIR